MKKNIHFSSYLAHFFLQRDIFQTNLVDKIKAHNLSIISNFFSEIRVFYETVWKNMAEIDRPRMTIWRMRIACWIEKVTNTHSECVIPIAFPLQQRLQEHSLVLRLFVHCLFCNKYFCSMMLVRYYCCNYQSWIFHEFYWISKRILVSLVSTSSWKYLKIGINRTRRVLSLFLTTHKYYYLKISHTL